MQEQDSTILMNSFVFFWWKGQVALPLKGIGLFSTTRWHDMFFFFLTLLWKRNPSLSLHTHIPTPPQPFFEDFCHFYCYEIWLGVSIKYLTSKSNLLPSTFFITWFCFSDTRLFVYSVWEEKLGLVSVPVYTQFNKWWTKVSSLSLFLSFCPWRGRRETKF